MGPRPDEKIPTIAEGDYDVVGLVNPILVMSTLSSFFLSLISHEEFPERFHERKTAPLNSVLNPQLTAVFLDILRKFHSIKGTISSLERRSTVEPMARVVKWEV